MEAWVIRPERLGDPLQAMQLERIDVPEPGPGEVRVRVMAAGVNYNGVWAAAGLPVSIFRYTGYDFHIAGSDASGVVDAVGPGVTRW
jgi:crotonyl-CoA carboxylase/reductase